MVLSLKGTDVFTFNLSVNFLDQTSQDFSGPNFGEIALWNVEMFSGTQILKTKQRGLRGKSSIIQTAGWQKGNYIVKVKFNNEIFSEMLVEK